MCWIKSIGMITTLFYIGSISLIKRKDVLLIVLRSYFSEDFYHCSSIHPWTVVHHDMDATSRSSGIITGSNHKLIQESHKRRVK